MKISVKLFFLSLVAGNLFIINATENVQDSSTKARKWLQGKCEVYRDHKKILGTQKAASEAERIVGQYLTPEKQEEIKTYPRKDKKPAFKPLDIILTYLEQQIKVHSAMNASFAGEKGEDIMPAANWTKSLGLAFKYGDDERLAVELARFNSRQTAVKDREKRQLEANNVMVCKNDKSSELTLAVEEKIKVNFANLKEKEKKEISEIYQQLNKMTKLLLNQNGSEIPDEERQEFSASTDSFLRVLTLLKIEDSVMPIPVLKQALLEYIKEEYLKDYEKRWTKLKKNLTKTIRKNNSKIERGKNCKEAQERLKQNISEFFNGFDKKLAKLFPRNTNKQEKIKQLYSRSYSIALKLWKDVGDSEIMLHYVTTISGPSYSQCPLTRLNNLYLAYGEVMYHTGLGELLSGAELFNETDTFDLVK